MDLTLKVCEPMLKKIADILLPRTSSANGFMKKILPIFEPVYLAVIKLLSPVTEPLSRIVVKSVVNCHPAVFEPRPESAQQKNQRGEE